MSSATTQYTWSPPPDEVTEGFWDATRERRLVVQRCRGCGHRQHYPRVLCTACGGTALDYAPAGGTGTVAGLEVDEAQVDEMETRFARALPQASCVVIGGSLPKGAPPDLHARLVARAKGAGKPVILDASLLGEFEKVKITLEATKFEEISNVWTALPQANFRRSVTYQVSVVQIESTRPSRLPMTASIMLSTSTCRASRQREAPSAARMVNSFCRPSARASCRLATLAQASSSTKPTAPASTIRICAVERTVSRWSDSTRTPRVALVSG